MSLLKSRIVADMKEAMKAKDKARVSAVRLMLAAIKQKEIDERIEVSDAQVDVILRKMLKQRKDSIEQFAKAGRDDLVAKESAEVVVIECYLPELLSEEKVQQIINQVVSEQGPFEAKDMGRLMGVLKGKLATQADMSLVSQLVKKALL